MTVDTEKRIDETARIMWVLFLTVWLAYSLVHTLSGCSDAAKRDIQHFFTTETSCEQTFDASVPTVENEVFNAVTNAIITGITFESPAWGEIADSLVAKYGFEKISCLASSIYNEIQFVKNSHNSDAGAPKSMVYHKYNSSHEGYVKALFNRAQKLK